MHIPYGQTIEVFRAPTARDRFGDTERVSIGTISNVVFQWATASSGANRFQSRNDFQEISTLHAVMFVPKGGAIVVSGRDRLKMNGTWFQVVGNPAWNEVMPATGHDFGYYMVQVEAVD